MQRICNRWPLNLYREISDAAETGNRHAWIEAVYGVGYRFEYPED